MRPLSSFKIIEFMAIISHFVFTFASVFLDTLLQVEKRSFETTSLMKLIPELFCPSLFTLLTAPVAAGKTRLVVNFYLEHDFKVIFISPLRALANEVYDKLNKEQKSVYLAGGDLPLEECMKKFLEKDKSFLVMTMELLSEDFLESCAQEPEKVLFILDEFHLFYHWGESFRPVLHDRFLAVLNTEAPILGITATMGEVWLQKLKHDLNYHFPVWIHLDYGNQQLHRLPSKIHCFQGVRPEIYYRTLWRELRLKEKKDIYLIFCAYRSEVDEFLERTRRMGLRSLGCVGGEVEEFLYELKEKNEELDCIIATTTLSHGVNLPEIKKVFINYEVKELDFWLQMIGRGGRRGSEYEVYTFDSFLQKEDSSIKRRISLYFRDLFAL